MSLAVRRLLTTPTRAPLPCLLLAAGLSVAGWGGLQLAALQSDHQPLVRHVSAPLRVSALPVPADVDQRSLEPRDLALLSAALPDVAVGGALELEVVELAPPLLPVDQLSVLAVDTAWLELSGFELAAGRGFSERDAATASSVCVVSPRIVAALGTGITPLGRHLRVDATWLTVVGLLTDAPADAGLPDIAVPLEAGALRMEPASASALDEILLGVSSDDPAVRTLVERVLERAHRGRAGWSLDGAVARDPSAEPLRSALQRALGLLILTGLALAGAAVQRLWGRG